MFPKIRIPFPIDLLATRWMIFGWALGLAACSPPKPSGELWALKGSTMGTTYLVKVVITEQGPQAPNAFQLDSVLERVNASLSTYLPTSLLSRFNLCTQCYQVDSMIIRNFKASQQVHQASSGAFDPSVYPLVQAWGFGPQPRAGVPDSALVRSLLSLVGLGQFRLQGDSLCKTNPGQMLDFSAIAKGYGVDVVGWYLESLGHQNYLVEIGGEVRARGEKNPGQPWTVAVEKPIDDPSGIQRDYLLQFPLNNLSMASSGNYRNFYMHNGQKMAHTLQVSTGYPTPTDVLAATVVTENCMMADAYATACMALGWKGAIAMLEKHPEINAILVGSTQNPSPKTPYRLYATPGLRDDPFYQDWVAGQRSK